MMQVKYYDAENNRLLYIYKKARPEYWDEFWKGHLFKNLHGSRISKFNYVLRKTRKFLKEGAKILEGGCGNGIHVYNLHKSGYDVVGLDYSPRIIDHLQKSYPELTFTHGDVRNIPFEENFFDGYWSCGVIEHFYEGYSSILGEMHRVIKPGGYLFLSFPHMSKSRIRKAMSGKYPIWNGDVNLIKDFFQFALDEKRVQEDFEKQGFRFLERMRLSGLSGLRDQSKVFFTLIDKFYNSKKKFIKPLKTMTSIFLTPWFSNSILLVFKKV